MAVHVGIADEILTRICLVNQDLKDYQDVLVHGLFIELAPLVARMSTHSRRRILHGKGDEHNHHWKRITNPLRNITQTWKAAILQTLYTS